MDGQLLFNIVLGIATSLAGWFFKSILSRIREMQSEVNEVEDQHDQDHRLMTDRLNSLALSLPEKYVNKGDFDNLVNVMHHRFDKLEEKLDALNSK
ncbi:MAG: hypothetical protein H8E05_00605 [Bacteroidetes bacterium]|nr:hypothetical protein [Bacteroidota bacterium]